MNTLLNDEKKYKLRLGEIAPAADVDAFKFGS